MADPNSDTGADIGDGDQAGGAIAENGAGERVSMLYGDLLHVGPEVSKPAVLYTTDNERASS